METVKRGQVWKHEKTGEYYVVLMAGEPTTYTRSLPQYKNHLLKKMGKTGVMLTALKHEIGVKFEDFQNEFGYRGEYLLDINW